MGFLTGKPDKPKRTESSRHSTRPRESSHNVIREESAASAQRRIDRVHQLNEHTSRGAQGAQAEYNRATNRYELNGQYHNSATNTWHSIHETATSSFDDPSSQFGRMTLHDSDGYAGDRSNSSSSSSDRASSTSPTRVVETTYPNQAQYYNQARDDRADRRSQGIPATTADTTLPRYDTGSSSDPTYNPTLHPGEYQAANSVAGDWARDAQQHGIGNQRIDTGAGMAAIRTVYRPNEPFAQTRGADFPGTAHFRGNYDVLGQRMVGATFSDTEEYGSRLNTLMEDPASRPLDGPPYTNDQRRTGALMANIQRAEEYRNSGAGAFMEGANQAIADGTVHPTQVYNTRDGLYTPGHAGGASEFRNADSVDPLIGGLAQDRAAYEAPIHGNRADYERTSGSTGSGFSSEHAQPEVVSAPEPRRRHTSRREPRERVVVVVERERDRPSKRHHSSSSSNNQRREYKKRRDHDDDW